VFCPAPGLKTQDLTQPLWLQVHCAPAMPTYHVALSFTRPQDCGDPELFALFGDAVKEATCVAIEISPVRLIIDCEPAAIDVLETVLRVALAARGGSLEQMVARPI
jgi:hypothetical protein